MLRLLVCSGLLLVACGEDRVITTYDRPDGISNFLSVRFQEHDINKDGYVDYVEFIGLPIAQKNPNKDAIFEEIDHNKDDKISRIEADSYMRLIKNKTQ